MYYYILTVYRWAYCLYKHIVTYSLKLVRNVHLYICRPPVAGIHGNPDLGCYSIALSGGYEDDVDLGESFIYTGEGGRDLKGTKTNPKVKYKVSMHSDYH